LLNHGINAKSLFGQRVNNAFGMGIIFDRKCKINIAGKPRITSNRHGEPTNETTLDTFTP
jgi:hypothetical protein